ALSLNEDLPFFTFFRANLVSKIVVGSEEPIAIPAVIANRLLHLHDLSDIVLRLGFRFGALACSAMFRAGFLDRDVGEFATGEAEKAGNKDRLGYLALFVRRRLERLSRSVREAI